MSTPVKSDRLARYLDLVSEGRERATLEELLQRIAEGEESIYDVARAWDVPAGRLLTWITADEHRHKQYLRALELAAHRLVSDALSIADEEPGTTGGAGEGDAGQGRVDAAEVANRKLRIDTRFRIAEKHAKAMYGTKQEQASQANIDLTEVLQAAKKMIAERVAERIAQRAMQAIEGEAKEVDMGEKVG